MTVGMGGTETSVNNPACKMCWGNGGGELKGVVNLWLVKFETLAMRGSLYLILPDWLGTRGLIVQRPRTKKKPSKMISYDIQQYPQIVFLVI